MMHSPNSDTTLFALENHWEAAHSKPVMRGIHALQELDIARLPIRETLDRALDSMRIVIR